MDRYLPDELSIPLPDVREADAVLFASVMGKASPSSAVNDLYGLIHRPIIAFDTSFRLIAYAFPRPFPFGPWEELASTGILSDEYIIENNSLFYQEKMYHIKHSSYFKGDITELFPQVDGPILSDGELIGYVGICVTCDEEVDKISYINDRLAETLALLIPRYEDDSEGMISDSLWERFLSRDMMNDSEASQLESMFPPPYRIAMLSTKSGQIPTLRYVKSCLEKSGAPLRTYIDRNEHLLILYYDLSNGSDDTENRITSELAVHAERYSLFCGISDRFFHLVHGPVARLQADISIEIGSRWPARGGLFVFRDIYKDIMCSYALERYGIFPSIPPVMRIERGKESSPDKIRNLIPTLEAYLDCDCNQEKTAEKLGIHKNTVAYRIRQFTEMTGTVLNDPAGILQIKIGMIMYRYITDLENRVGKEAMNGSFRK